MDFEDAREQFPALLHKTFLDAACVSLAPRVATEAIRNFLDMTLLCPARSSTLHHISMDEMRALARPEAARLINADEDEIALVESTSHGLSIAAQSIPLSPGDRVLISDLEFLEVAVPWIQLATQGIGIDVVRNQGGEVRVENIAERLSPNTRVVCMSTVQWSNGFRCDLEKLSSLCADKGVWLVVDAIQQLGAIPLDVQKTPVDFLACGGHKWLNSPFGTGFLYIRREALRKLLPPLTGYMNVEPPQGGWGAHFQTPSIRPVMDYEFTKGARVYEVGGTANYAGGVGLAAALKMIHSLGQDRIAEHTYALTDHLIEGLQALDIEIVTPVARQHRSGIVTFSIGSAAENIRLMDKLLELKILVSVRYTSNVGGVRVSCHFFNNIADIDRVLEAVESAVPRKSNGPVAAKANRQN
jgi:selenocysteine lyase/cysteine desulfurase